MIFFGEPGEPQASWNMHDFMVQQTLGCQGVCGGGVHHLEPIGVFLKSEAVLRLPARLLWALEGFPPGPRTRDISFPWMICVPHPWRTHSQPAPVPSLPASFHRLSVCKHVENCLPETVQFSTSPAVFWPPLLSASRLKFFFLVSMRHW